MLSVPGQMFEHGLDAKKGWFEMHSLDFDAKLSANVTFPVPAGRVVHVNTAKEFEMGVRATDMAIFLLNGSRDADVSNPGTTAGGLFVHKAISPTGKMSGLVATGGYEIDTTEFDGARTYVPGQLLTAEASNADAAVGGVLTNEGSGAGGLVEQYTDPVCGVVSTGSRKNHNGVQVLAFWPCFLPGAAA